MPVSNVNVNALFVKFFDTASSQLVADNVHSHEAAGKESAWRATLSVKLRCHFALRRIFVLRRGVQSDDPATLVVPSHE